MKQSYASRPAVWQLLVGLLFLGLAMTVQAQRSSQPFTLVEPPQATEAGDKVEVLDFFQYGCPHCRAMEPLIAKWTSTLGDDVVVRHIPVAFNASMEPWQYLYFTLEALNRLDLQPAVFTAVQTERNPLNTPERVAEWAAKKGLDRAQFEATYKSFGVAAKVKRAQQLIAAYNINSVPTLAVGGRYITSPALANGYGESLQVADTLIQRVRQEG